jgi:subtilisin-like proprotein convertase family protein
MNSASLFSSRRLLQISALALLSASAGQIQAAVFTGSWNSGFTSNGVVPDGNAAGWSDSRSQVVPAGETIVDVNVTISLTGGWNGDLYAFLTNSGSPSVAVLLNRPGRTPADSFGYGDNALTITFDDSAANGDVHFYQSVPGYAASITNNSAWQPDGRTASPLLVSGGEPRLAMLSGFDGLSASTGTWTLFVADLSTGDVSTVGNWGLTVTTIPEPGAVVLSAGAAGLFLIRRRARPKV